MKILFVVSNLKMVDWKMDFHFSIAQLSAALKQHHYETDLFIIGRISDYVRFYRYLREYQPQMVGFSFTEISYSEIVTVAKKIRKLYPKIHLSAGGTYCILNPHEVINSKVFDSVCIGEGEEAIVDLANSINNKKLNLKINNLWFYHNGQVITNPINQPVDLNTLPTPDYDIFYSQNKLTNKGSSYLWNNTPTGYFLMSRSCPFDCPYCANKKLKENLGQHYFRIVSPPIGINQIITATKKYKFKQIVFYDDTLTINTKWFNEFIRLYKNKIHLPFTCNIRIGTFNEATVKAMKAAGCTSVTFGLESGNESFRFNRLNRPISDKQIIESTGWFKKYGIEIGTYNMIGLPDETNKNIRETIELNAKINVDIPICFIFHPFKGTELYDYCLTNKLLKKKMPSNFILKEDTLLNFPSSHQEDVKYYYRNFNYLVNLKKTERNLLKRLHKSILFYLHAAPPSSPLYNIKSKVIKIKQLFI